MEGREGKEEGEDMRGRGDLAAAMAQSLARSDSAAARPAAPRSPGCRRRRAAGAAGKSGGNGRIEVGRAARDARRGLKIRPSGELLRLIPIGATRQACGRGALWSALASWCIGIRLCTAAHELGSCSPPAERDQKIIRDIHGMMSMT